MRERPQTRSASLWLLQWRGVRHRCARRFTPHLRTCAAPCGGVSAACGGASAACGALRNTIANIKREKHQGQRHEAPQRMALHIKKNLKICSETLKKRVKIFQQELTCSWYINPLHFTTNFSGNFFESSYRSVNF